MIHLDSGATTSILTTGNEKHLLALQSMVRDVKEDRIDLEEARVINETCFFADYHKIWVPGPEVLADSMLADRILSARTPSMPDGGRAEYTIIPIQSGLLLSNSASAAPVMKTIYSSSGVSCKFNRVELFLTFQHSRPLNLSQTLSRLITSLLSSSILDWK